MAVERLRRRQPGTAGVLPLRVQQRPRFDQVTEKEAEAIGGDIQRVDGTSWPVTPLDSLVI
jgi:hypothetical protein